MTHNAPAPKAQNLGTLFFTFFKIGLFTFGGGYAMIALLEEEFIHLPRLQAGRSPRRGGRHRGRLPAVLSHHLRHLAVF